MNEPPSALFTLTVHSHYVVLCVYIMELNAKPCALKHIIKLIWGFCQMNVKHFFGSQGLAGIVDWTRQSLGMFSNFKQLQCCSWRGGVGKPTNTKSFIHGN